MIFHSRHSTLVRLLPVGTFYCYDWIEVSGGTVNEDDLVG